MLSDTDSFRKFLLIQHRDGKESQGEFDDFLTDVREHYEPVGFLEESGQIAKAALAQKGSGDSLPIKIDLTRGS